jgi:hypothetical protein
MPRLFGVLYFSIGAMRGEKNVLFFIHKLIFEEKPPDYSTEQGLF